MCLCLGHATIRLLVMEHRAVLSSLLKPIFHKLRHHTGPLQERVGLGYAVIK